MKNKELITDMSTKLEETPENVSEMIADFVSVLSSCMLEEDVVYIQGFGQFEVRKKAERICVNPTNGKRYLVPPKLVATFKPGTTLKNKLKESDINE